MMNTENPLVAAWQPRLLSVMRMVVGVLFMSHGAQKLFNFPPSDHPMSIQLGSLMGVAGLLELVGGGLIILGLFTRPVAFILSGEMAVAYFMQHAPHGFWPIVNKGESAVLYCFAFLFMAVAGAGSWSLDALFSRAQPRSAPIGSNPQVRAH